MKDVRKHRRHNLEYPCEFQIAGVPIRESLAGNVLNISAGGCKLRVQIALCAGELPQLEMEVGNRSRKQVLDRIVYAE